MSADPRHLFKGALVVARRDLLANVKSVKVVVLSAVMLLVMVGAAFGLSGFLPTRPGVVNEYAMWAFATYPSPNVSFAGAAVRVTDYAGVAKAGVAVDLGYPYVGTPNEAFRLKTTNTTNAQGWTRFSNLGAGTFPLQIQLGPVPVSDQVTVLAPTNQSFSMIVRQFNLLNDGTWRDIGIEAARPDGTPLSGVPVYINATARGNLSSQGFFYIRLDTGAYAVNVTYAGHDETHFITVRPSTSLLPFQLGPDVVIYVVAFSLMGFFAPVIAIALSYDALSKERAQGSLELLLVRPASRTGLAVGKFLGTFLSIGLPVLGVAVGTLVGLATITGKWPDLAFDVAFLLGTLGLIAMYVLIMQVFSTVVKSSGTAILSAILVWLVFSVLWSIVNLLVQAVLGIETGTAAYYDLNTVMLLFNPTGVFQLTIAAYLPPSLAEVAGSYQLPNWSGPLAMLVWIGALLVVAVLAFKKKIV